MSKYIGNPESLEIKYNNSVASLIYFNNVKDLKNEKNDIVTGICYE